MKELIKNKLQFNGEAYIIFPENLPDYVKDLEKVGHKYRVIFDIPQVIELVNKGFSWEKKNKTIVVDYFSANIGKPPHFGNLRSAIIGNPVKKVLQKLGYNVIGVNWWGDFGTQFGELIYAFKQWGSEEELRKNAVRHLYSLYVKFNQELEKNPELKDKAREEYRVLEETMLKYLKEGVPKDVEEAINNYLKGKVSLKEIMEKFDSGKVNYILWKIFREETINWARREFYPKLNLEFEEESGESFFLLSAREIVRELLEKGVAEVDKDGSVIVKTSKGVAVLLKKDGTTLYITRDLAAAKEHYEKYKFEKKIYVVANEQTQHFQQLFEIVEKANYPFAGKLVHLKFGLVLMKTKEGVKKFSTRKGRAVFATDVLEEAFRKAYEEVKKRNPDKSEKEIKKAAEAIGYGAVIYAIVKYDPKKDVIFDWEKILSLEGKTGPFVQYSAVRAKRILEKWESLGNKVEEIEKPTNLEGDEERLLLWLFYFPAVLEQIERSLKPNILAEYLYNLAEEFNRFYEKNRVIGSEREKERIWLVRKVYETLKEGLRLLGMKAPEFM